jgi:hypothetical protein
VRELRNGPRAMLRSRSRRHWIRRPASPADRRAARRSIRRGADVPYRRVGVRNRGATAAAADRLPRRLRRRRRLGCLRALTGWKQRERVEVTVRVGGLANPEVHVRDRPLRFAARTDRPHDVTLGDRSSDGQTDRAEVDERDGVTVCGPDRQTETRMRKRAREGDEAVRRRAHVRPHRRTDVDAAMLAARVRIVPRDERPQHRPVDRPGPGVRVGDVSKRDDDEGREDQHSVA